MRFLQHVKGSKLEVRILKTLEFLPSITNNWSTSTNNWLHHVENLRGWQISNTRVLLQTRKAAEGRLLMATGWYFRLIFGGRRRKGNIFFRLCFSVLVIRPATSWKNKSHIIWKHYIKTFKILTCVCKFFVVTFQCFLRG